MSLNAISSIKSNASQFPEPVNNNRVIEEITKLIKANQAVCLFIGRKEDEELPNEPQATWVSFDISTAGSCRPNRLHLIGDMNQLDPCLYGLFSKVVVDQSTWKFFRAEPKPIESLTKLLKEDPKSTLIFENTLKSSPIMSSCDLDLGSWEFDEVILSISNRVFYEAEKRYFIQKEQVYQCFVDEKGSEADVLNSDEFHQFVMEWEMQDQNPEIQKSQFKNYLAEEKGINYVCDTNHYSDLAQEKQLQTLKALFNQATLTINSTYPYSTRYSHPGKDSYFTAIGPKRLPTD